MAARLADDSFTDLVKPSTALKCESSSFLSDEYSDIEVDTDSCDLDLDDLPDVDRRNLCDPAKLSTYAEQIYLTAQRDAKKLGASSGRITSMQTDITPELREFGVACIFAIQQQYEMTSDTLFQAVTIMNLSLSHIAYPREQLRLLAMTCFWMSAKMEENGGPKLSDVSEICQCAYVEDDFAECERQILSATRCILSFPTAYFFLERLLDAVCATELTSEAANFFCELSLIPIDFVDITPDLAAVASVCAAKLAMGDFCPIRRLMAYGHINELEAVKECCKKLIDVACDVIENKQHFMYYRFTTPPARGAVLQMTLSTDLISKM
jgi:hypothetical protein